MSKWPTALSLPLGPEEVIESMTRKARVLSKPVVVKVLRGSPNYWIQGCSRQFCQEWEGGDLAAGEQALCDPKQPRERKTAGRIWGRSRRVGLKRMYDTALLGRLESS